MFCFIILNISQYILWTHVITQVVRVDDLAETEESLIQIDHIHFT